MEWCTKQEEVKQDDAPDVKPVVCNHEPMMRSLELEAHKAVQEKREYKHMYTLSVKQVRRLQAENRELKCRLAQCENDHRQSASKSTSSSEDGKLSNRSDAETQTFADADEVQEPPAKRRRSSGYQAESTVREVEHPIEQLLAVVEEPQPVVQSSNDTVSDAGDAAVLAVDWSSWLRGKHPVSAVYEYRAKKHLTAPTWEPECPRPRGAALYHVAKLRLDNEVFESDELPTIKLAKADAAMRALLTLADAWVVLNSA
ncbi:hypothetical protein AAVH_06132 [Aphelenchoides avenae]|nr:hypothetical protein AAVH_06132 [Aphelenchus avenae]